MEKIDNLTVIKDIMNLYNLTQTEFATRIGVHQANLSEMMRGKRACGNGIMAKVRLAFPEINTNWLDTGEGEMLKPQQPSVQQNNYNGNNNYVVGSGNCVQCSHPMVVDITDCCEVECPKCGEPIEVSGGAVMRVVPTEITKLPDINIEYWRKKNEDDMPLVNFIRAWGPDTFAVKVDTRAMEPDYREGTYLVLRKLPDLSCARADGSPYVVDTMRPHTLFRNLTDKYDGTYLLTANSDKRSSIRLKAADITNVYDIVGSFRLGR